MIALGYVANFRKKYTVSIKSIYFVNVPSHSAKLKTKSLLLYSRTHITHRKILVKMIRR